MLMRDLSLDLAPAEPRRWRALAAALLRLAGRALESLAMRLAIERPAPSHEPVREYHAEAGAPEGALYVDGRLVGHVLGVTRL